MRNATRLIWIVVGLVLVLAPLGLPPFAMTLLTEAVILGLFAMSLDLMFGYTRLVSFGHAAAYGFGAYACGWLLLHTGMPLLFAVFAAGLLTGVMAIGVGWMCTLATGVSFSMLTLALAQLLYAISFKWTSVTGGSDGLAGIPRTIGPFGFAALSSKAGFYYLALGCLVGGFLICSALVRSPFGAVLRGIRENEAKTTALGYNTRLYKIAVVAISYGLGGLAGALYAPFAGFANTELLFWLLSGQVLIMVIVGGAGTLIGPVLGAAFFMLMEHQLSAWTEAWALYFGLIFIATNKGSVLYQDAPNRRRWLRHLRWAEQQYREYEKPLNADSSFLNPPSLSSRFSAGSSQSSNRTSCRYSPPMVWNLPARTRPGVPFSTRTQPMPSRPGRPLTRVNTTKAPASSARLTSVFTPLRRSVSPRTVVLVA